MASIFVGSGLSPVKDGGRFPMPRSVHRTVCVAVVPLNVMALEPLAQVPSYCVAVGWQLPQVMSPLAVWRLSTSWGVSVTVIVTDVAGAVPALTAVKVPLMSKEI